jgi:DNA-binding transcriptional MerR regulator
MTNADELTLWRYVRLLHVSHHHLGVSVEALRKLADENGLSERLTALEKSASQESSQIHDESLREIDHRIQKLMKAVIPLT